MICKTCNESEAEWMEMYCQECWESHCSAEFWAAVLGLDDRRKAWIYANNAARRACPDFDQLEGAWGL